MTYNEADHPRDELGRYTYKNGGSNNSNTYDREKYEKTANLLYGGVDKNYYWVDANKKAIADRHEKFEQGSFPPHELKNLAAVNYIQNPYVKNYATDKIGKEAAENLYMSKKGHYLDTDYAKKHLVFNNYKEVNSELQPYLKEKISKQIGKDKLDSTKGIYIDDKSQSSKDIAQVLANNKEFQEKLIENGNKLKNGIPFDTSINFSDKNFHHALGNVDVLNVRKLKNGDIETLVVDTYDFNKGEKNDLVRLGRERQESGDIIPYFIIYRAIIPKNVKINSKGK